MVDITKHPYFSYNQQVEPLFLPIRNQANVQFLNFVRKYPNRERSCIILNKEHTVDWCASEFYRHSIFERPDTEEQSGFYMWDHVRHDNYSLSIREHNARRHNIAHGLTIIQKGEEHCDFFSFVTTPGNDQINNFYLNNKALLEDFVVSFYLEMAPTIEFLTQHKIYIPGNVSTTSIPMLSLSPRQLDCALLMTDGLTAKEIGKALALSHRTVEEYIDVLKLKFEAKNRLHLIAKLQKHI